jgi:Trypsin-like serine proteases, typically periplasmic, contain C-terminal PDZ domain
VAPGTPAAPSAPGYGPLAGYGAEPVTGPVPPPPGAMTTPSRVPVPPPPANPYPGDPYQPPPAPPTGAYPWPAAGPVPGGRPPGSVRRVLVAGVAALAIALVGGVVGGFVGYAARGETGNALQLPVVSGNSDAAPVVDRSSLASIAAALQPAIVHITTDIGEGSGVVISPDGHIVTNNHVIAGARRNGVRVTFNSGRQVPATIVGADPQTDIAVIKVDAENLTVAPWGDSDSVQVGDTVLAIGSPLGLQGTVTAGIVSALNRTIRVTEGPRSQFDTGSATVIGGAIQTDAPINAGNSGGALVNMRGEVIGINTAIATAGMNGNIGVGFAISSNRAKSVADALIAGEAVKHPYIGVQITDDEDGGAQIREVVEGSPAERAGLTAGDVVTRVNGQPIRGTEDLIGIIQSSTVGEELTLTVRRNGTERTVTVTVGEQ